ncbi:uncharacterized protein BX663DRAFT_562363 [Cokeromyces recurvatus]|uniref:uncharacterized protein n=1 Tax=Cokeromyces recurvatus TaxID=90255 RepID=UPI00221F6888|nr:uncharacterized protein BX663DRAFT_562363 [Cokeromyces recurvatus]KAI7901470.1 hypothetical protein BX663DRAFT_562363 [Cokeromyces recurvatus]
MIEEVFAQKLSPINPSKNIKSTTNYSLFNNNKSTFDFSLWDWKTPSHKNSIQVESDHNVSLDNWRRASAPNIRYSACTFCHDKYSRLYTSSCGQHYFCHFCSAMLTQGQCPFCTQQNTPTYLPSTPITTSNTVRNFIPILPSSYPCIKLSNIPWDVSQNDVRYFFGNCRSPSPSICIQSIHIMMNRTTGKTLSDAYVEFASVLDMQRAIETRNQKPLKGRIVSVTECSQEELLMTIFPKWRGQFQGIYAIPPTIKVVRTMSTAAGGGNSGCSPPFVTREEINSLLVVCKNYKLHFSRKCAERPFENIISIIAKYPWHQLYLISVMHRDHIYEMLKLSIEALKLHLAKDYVQIDPTLLERLTRAGIMCPAFTERQKKTLLQTASIECPKDIVHLLTSQNTTTTTTTTTTAAAATASAAIPSIFNPTVLSTCSTHQVGYNSDTFSSTISSTSSTPLRNCSELFSSQISTTASMNTCSPDKYDTDSSSSQISSIISTTLSPPLQRSSLDLDQYLNNTSFMSSFFKGRRTTSRMKFVEEDDDPEDVLSFTPSESSPLISSLIRDIQSQCSIIDDAAAAATTFLQKSPSSTKLRWNNTFPLLLQPLPYSLDESSTTNNSSSNNNKATNQEHSLPWASSYNNIWRMPVEPNTRTSSKRLLAA